ncbi:large subunit GTPase 1 homolog isoform X1 [Varroa jacobsoni]|uniref:large subunit GTPase 1 homolog isoform X1 n=1 Tax=Varroa jacobsoni TaxID=62625 RepID=UPI000BF55FAD|nr:large subunit GTPase 1 homolog isoform X1 [Varroa jacobsoni]
MTKKSNHKNGLGRALIKDRIQKGARPESFRHTTEMKDGYDWSTNMTSITEQNNLDEFLATAELAGANFTAEKLNVRVVTDLKPSGVLSEADLKLQKKLYDLHRNSIRVPRRPQWNARTTAEELDASEREAFLVWRRELVRVQEIEGIHMTPYEKNLEFWRQLWRVVERSDIVVQIVDARNPLLFFCEDLFTYVKEISPHKKCMVLFNKSDFLNEDQRRHWAEYFKKRNDGLKVVFFSALGEAIVKDDGKDNSDEHLSDELLRLTIEEYSATLWSKEQLVHLCRTWHTGVKYKQGFTTVGLCGYPNVGKSSTINAITKSKKVSVSSTPGKTKHFQTIHLCNDLILCDCPGLVFPNFVSSKAEMVINGILPIDQLRDHVPPVSLLLSLIPRHVLEDTYGICIPRPREGEDPDRPPTSAEFLNAYSYNRGFMTSSGQPDNSRGARYILKDYVSGKLVYCIAPPGVDQASFHEFPQPRRAGPSTMLPSDIRMTMGRVLGTDEIDKNFFASENVGVGFKGRHLVRSGLTASSGSMLGAKKHFNRNKREKLRRLYQHKDA